MLNPFPDLLMLGFVAPTLIRVAAGCLLLYTGYYHWNTRSKIADISFPLIGRSSWAAPVSAIAHFAVGAMFIFGYYVQIAALLGILASLKGVTFAKKYEVVFPYQRSTYVLLLVICASLMLSGAGAFAFDLPL